MCRSREKDVYLIITSLGMYFTIPCLLTHTDEGADSLEGRWEMKGWEVGDGVMGGGREVGEKKVGENIIPM